MKVFNSISKNIGRIFLSFFIVLLSVQSFSKNINNLNSDFNIDHNSKGVKSTVNVLVATPDAKHFNNLMLDLMLEQGSNINYTVTSSLGELDVNDMLDYNVVWTFNASMWEDNTGLNTPLEWSNKLGAYIDAGGRLLECEFVQSNDSWGLGGGAYIAQHKSPFTQATSDNYNSITNMGTVALPNHPIMEGVDNISTNYFYQNVQVQPNATLIANWEDGYPLIAINDNVVAVNLACIGLNTKDKSYNICLFDDGFKMIYNSLNYLYSTLAPMGAPAGVEHLTATPDNNTGLNIELSWQNPTHTAQGEVLNSISYIKIYDNNNSQPIHTINNPSIGESLSWTANGLSAGSHIIKVVAENSNGEGVANSVNTFVGLDVPSAVDNLTLTSSNANGVLTWDAPVIGLNNGALGNSPITYKIVRFPDNIVLENEYTNTSYTDNSINNTGVYYYTVTASNAQGVGGTSESNSTMLGSSVELPYTMGFESGEQYDMWTIIDANEDGKTWERITDNGVNESCCMRYSYNFNSSADDWLISPKLTLEAGKSYGIRLKAKKKGENYTETFKIFLGSGVTPESLTNQIFDVEQNDVQLSIIYQNFETTFNVEESGDYHIGIQATSPKNQFLMFVDDIEIYELEGDDLRAVSIRGPKKTIVGKETNFIVNIQNIGTNVASNYSVNLLDEDNNILASVNNCPSLNPQQYTEIELTYTPTVVGDINIKGEVNLSSDNNISNNFTPNHLLTVVEDNGEFVTQIGEGTTLNRSLPVNFYWKQSITQIMYYKEDINMLGGGIVEISFYYNFEHTLSDKPIKIWMANTTQEELTDWYPQDEFTLVFDGVKSFNYGENKLTFELIPGAFEYTGENIVMMFDKTDPEDKDWCNFYQTDDPNGRKCAIYYVNDLIPFNWSQPGTVETFFPNIDIKFVTESGSLSGVVRDSETNNTLDNVKICYDNLSSTSTNENGEYNFDFITVGQHQVEASKHGYFSSTKSVNINDGENTIQDFDLEPLPLLNVTGKVVSSLNSSEVIENAKVILSGYDNYNTTTLEDGTFTLEDVYEANKYSFVVKANGYMYYADTINITNNSSGIVDLGDISLVNLDCKKVDNFTVTADNNVVTLNWDEPTYTKEFKVENGKSDNLTIIKEKNRDIENNLVKIILVAYDVWEDGTGYQFLLDADYNTYGNIIPISGPLFHGESEADDFYTSNFEYMIPYNAEPNVNTEHAIVNGKGEVIIPQGTYDWCITNPTPGENAAMWISSDFGSHPSRADNYFFEGGYQYTFTMNRFQEYDGTDLIIDNLTNFEYNIYKDDNLLTTTSNLFYKDENVENGEHEYCVEVVYGDLCNSELVCEIVDVTTNIKDYSAISIYPNPANNIVYIDGVNIEKIYIYNNVGSLVKEVISNSLDVTNFAKGLYVIKIFTTDGEVVSSKLIVE